VAEVARRATVRAGEVDAVAAINLAPVPEATVFALSAATKSRM